MKDVLTDIQDGTFARNWIAENEAGKKKYDEMQAADLSHQIEATGKELRGLMAWLQTDEKKKEQKKMENESETQSKVTWQRPPTIRCVSASPVPCRAT